MEGCPISGDSRVDHLTFKGEGARIFFSLASGASTIFLGLFIFLAIRVAWGFFCTAKALQEMFSQIFYSSGTLKDQMVHPLE